MQVSSRHLSILLYIVAACIFFGFSIYYMQFYIHGDQRAYRGFYESILNAPIAELPLLQQRHTGSAEPLYGILMWVGAQFTSKDIWISVFNAVLGLIVLRLLISRRVSLYIYPLIFSNFYLIVLFFGAERLKFAVIMALLFIASSGRWKYVFALLAPMFHFQIFLLAGALAGGQFSTLVRGVFAGKLRLLSIVSTFALAAGVGLTFLYFSDLIQDKASNYEGAGLSGLWKTVIFFVVAIFFTNDRISTALSFGILASAILAVGEERVNLMSFFLAITASFSWNRGFNPITIMMLAYFSYTGVIFLDNIVKFGNGFAR